MVQKLKDFMLKVNQVVEIITRTNSNTIGKTTLKQGQQFYIGNEQYEVANAYAKTTQTGYTAGYQGTGMANAGSSYKQRC